MDGRFVDHDGPDEPENQDDLLQPALTLGVMRRIGVTVGDLWIYYLSMGGNVEEYEVDAYLHGLMRLPALDRDMVSQSVNEMLDDMNRGPKAPYSTGTSTAEQGPDRAALPGEASSLTDVPWAISETEVLSLVYSSVAARPWGQQDLIDLLRSSRQTNGASGVTGLLLSRTGYFLQVLEGPERIVRDLMKTIAADPRHTGMRVLLDEKRQHRRFPNWTMGFERTSDSLAADVPGFERIFGEAGEDEDPADTARVTEKLISWFEDNAQHP